MDLIAKKRLTYAGRVYRPGVGFTARTPHARVLVASGMARFAKVTAMSREAVPDGQVDGCATYKSGPVKVHHEPLDVADLRARYEAAAGKKPNMRWGVKRLEQEIAAL